MSPPFRIQVLGLTRFSYPANLDAFQTRHDSMAARRAALYAPERLDLRFLWFEQVALPCLRAQTDPDFTHLVLIGDDLPAVYRDRMEAVVADVPQVRLIPRATANHRDVYREILLEARDRRADVVAEHRLDDDDGVAVDFVASARSDFARGREIFADHGKMAVDYQKGIVIHADGDGVAYVRRVTKYWAPGLVTYFQPDFDKCTMDFPHHRVWWRMPTLTFSNKIMYLRGSHATNDSAIKLGEGMPFKLAPDKIAPTLKRRFNVDTIAFETGWKALCITP